MESINKIFIQYQKNLTKIKQSILQNTEFVYLELQTYLDTVIQQIDSLYEKFLNLMKKKQEEDQVRRKLEETSELLQQANLNIELFGEKQSQIKEAIMEINAQKMDMKFPVTKKHKSQKEIKDYLFTLENTYDTDLFTQ